MENRDTTTIETMRFPTTKLYIDEGWCKDDSIEVQSANTGRLYTIVVTAVKPSAIEGVITIVNQQRIGKEAQRKVTLYNEDGVFVVYPRT
jgi:hypothetical protein